jgi:DNA-binding response OmpR family regulator
MVMVVDDEPMIRKLVASALTTSGYRVIDAETPEHAIRLFNDNPALQLLVTDIVMPGIGGCELAARLRQKRPELKVLFMSGFAPGGMRTDPEQGEFLQKPFHLRDLIERVRRMLA